MAICVRCGEKPAVDDSEPRLAGIGLCGHCHWAIRAEIEQGFAKLRDYLRAWAKYEAWCAARGRPT